MDIDPWSEELGEELASAALTHGLPTPPVNFRSGMSVPVARWIGNGVGAVLSIEWMAGGEPEVPDYPCTEVRCFLPSDTGWVATDGSGGNGWFDPPFLRPEIEPTELIRIGLHMEQLGHGTIHAVSGVVGRRIEVIEVIHGDTSIRYRVESPFGAFVAAVKGDGPAELVAYLADGTEAGRCLFATSP